MAGDCIPLFRPGMDLTCLTTAAVAGRKFVELSGPLNATTGQLASVGLPSAGGTVLGVAAYDVPTATRVPVIRTPKAIVPVLAGATITSGQELQVDATGAVVPFTSGVKVGRALCAAASGAECFVTLY